MVEPGVTKCQFSCDWDFYMIGRDYVICEDNDWDRPTPMCACE